MATESWQKLKFGVKVSLPVWQNFLRENRAKMFDLNVLLDLPKSFHTNSGIFWSVYNLHEVIRW